MLDVKVGSGAFMKSREDAKRLARTLIAVGKKSGLKVRAVLTNMNQPLGYAVGNAIEVREAIELLRGEQNNETVSCDLKELTIQLCAHMLEIGNVVKNINDGRNSPARNSRTEAPGKSSRKWSKPRAVRWSRS